MKHFMTDSSMLLVAKFHSRLNLFSVEQIQSVSAYVQ